MVRQAQTANTERNPYFIKQPRNGGEDNLAWGLRAVRDMKASGPRDWTYITLLGGTDTMAFRLRAAQAVMRRDMLPSFWSEAILVKLKSDSLQDAEATHVPLAQPGGGHYAPFENGLVSCALEVFRDPAAYPNIALIALPVPQAKMFERVEDFKRARGTLDASEHIVRWLAYLWGVARTSNPLHENYGIPSACMLETVCAAEDYDLTPGLESRASCPEAIWSAASFWHKYYAKMSGDKRKIPMGRHSTMHYYDIREPEDRHRGPPPASPQPARTAARAGAKKRAR